MKINKQIIWIGLLGFLLSCNQADSTKDKDSQQAEEVLQDKEVHLSALKFKNLGIKLDSIPHKSLSDIVYANGVLEVPPQFEALVTAVVGGNIKSIHVIEGNQVKKGQLLAYLSHPDLIKIQLEYSKAFHNLQYLEKEHQRQSKMYEEEVGSGKIFQRSYADFQTAKAEVSGLGAQLKQLNLALLPIQEGKIFEEVPIVSPIDGFIEKVLIKIGQFVDSQKPLFKIINTHHIHADLMVYEKDAHKLKKGQRIVFQIESMRDEELTAEIYSVGNVLEQDINVVHVHAEIVDSKGYLLPGMYIKGKIYTSENKRMAVPEEAIITENGKSYLFEGHKGTAMDSTEWSFHAIEVMTVSTVDGWVEIKLMKALKQPNQVVMNQAFYLISEMRKGEASHDH